MTIAICEMRSALLREQMSASAHDVPIELSDE